MEILVVLLIFLTGIAMGLYYSSQLEEGIDKRTTKETYKDFVKKHYKKRK